MSGAEPGRLLAARYRLRAVIRRDEMGAVWLATDGRLRTDVAVRAIASVPTADAGEQQARHERAVREARALAQAGHPNIVEIRDTVEDDGQTWLILAAAPYRFPYRSLGDVVRSDGPLRPEQAAHVGWQVAAALGAAHAAGVLHRGVKPGSVLLGAGNQVMLTDFCMVTMDGGAALTAPAALAGAPFYLAPEQARGEPATPATDLWSLGATLYAAVEGRVPFGRDGAAAVLAAVISESPDPPRRAGPLWPVLSGLLRKDAAARPGAADAAWLLQRVAGSQGIARPASTAPMPAAVTGRDTEDHQTGPLPAVTAAAPPAPDAGDTGSAADFIPGFGPYVEPPAASQPPAASRPAAASRPLPRPGRQSRSRPGWQSRSRPGWQSLPRKPWQPWQIVAATGGTVAAVLAVTFVALLPASTTTSAPSLAVPVSGHGGWSPGHAPAGPRHQGTAPVAQSASGARRVVPPGPAVPEPVRPVPRAPRGGGARALPAGFYRYHDTTGFSIGVPAHWQVSHAGHLVYIRDPRGGMFLIVDQTSRPQPSPLADWRHQEAARIGSYPGYHRILLRAVHYAPAERAADWEFTYYDNGQLTQVLNRNILVNAHHAYALYWSTPARAWRASYHYFRVFASTFRPAPAGRG